MLDDVVNQAKIGLGSQLKQQVLGAKKPEPKKAAGILQQINPFEKKEKESGGEVPVAPAGEAQKKAQEDFVGGLYGVEQPPEAPVPVPVQSSADKNKPQSKETAKLLKNNQNKSPEELEKIMGLRNTLHNQQVGDLFKPPPERPEEAQKEQETAAQRMDRLHQEDLQKKQEEDEKKKPIAVTNAETARENKGQGSG